MTKTVDISRIVRAVFTTVGAALFGLEKRGYKYDYGKRMWSKSWSKCHEVSTQMQTTLNGQVLKVPFNTLGEKQQERVVFPQYCNSCHKPCKLEWSFKFK